MALSSQLETTKSHEQICAEALAFDKHCSILAQGYTHKSTLTGLFTSVPGVHPEEDLALKRIGVARIHAFIERGINFRRPSTSQEGSSATSGETYHSRAPYSAYLLSPAVPLLSLQWPRALQDEIAGLLRHYVQEGYFALNGPITGSWDDIQRDDLVAESALEQAVECGCAAAILTLIDMGADASVVPAKPRVVSGLTRIESGDLLGFVDSKHGHASSQAASVRSALMKRAIASSGIQNAEETLALARPRRVAI